MAEQLAGDPFAGTNRYVPHIGGQGPDAACTVSILRRQPDIVVVVWSVVLDTPKAARTLHAWMTANPRSWSVWGRLALRLGPDAAGSLILKAATDHERDRIEQERGRRPLRFWRGE